MAEVVEISETVSEPEVVAEDVSVVVEEVSGDNVVNIEEIAAEVYYYQLEQEVLGSLMKSVLPPNISESFAGYFEEPKTGSCPRFEEKKEVVEELIDVSKEMTGEALRDIADKALMGKLKEVDSESEESKSVSSVSVKQEESGVQEIKSVKLSESESNNVGKTDCVEQKYPDGVEAALNLKLRSIEDDLPETIDVTFSPSDTDKKSQVIKTIVDQVLDEESDKSEKAQSEKSKPSVEVKKMENALKSESNIFKDDVVEFENEVDKFLDEFPPITNKIKTIVKEEVPNVTFDFPKTNEKCDVVFGSVSEGLSKSILSKWIMDSGASRHMTGTLALLYDVKSINGSYVGFAGNQGGRIVGQGTLSNGVIPFDKPASVLFNPIHNVCCSLDEEQNPLLSEFRSILEFMRRVPILKALIEKRLMFRSHIKRFWKHASYDEQSKTINSVVKINDEKKPIVISEVVIREIIDFPDEENSPTKLPEKMVKGCMLRMGYVSDLNSASYLKSKFTKLYKFLIHSVLIAMSHQEGGFDTMRDYLMNMVVALVLNKKYNFSHIVFHYMVDEIVSDRKTWLYPRFVQMMLDHAYPNLDRDEENDLLVLSHMDNDSIRSLARYHPKHPEPTKFAELFGAIKDENYQDPDPENHEHWRSEEERKEKGYADELKILKNFMSKRGEWFLKEQKKKKKTKKATSKTQKDEDEPEEVEPVVAAEEDLSNVDDHMLFDNDVLETGPTVVAEVDQVVNVEAQKGKDKVIDDIEGDDVDKDTTSSSSSSEEEVDETERLRKVQEAIEKEKLLRKRKRQEKDDDDAYVPSPEHVSESQSPPSGRKKAGARDFYFANTSQVKNVEKKVDEVIAENKKLAAENKKVIDRERILEMRVKRLENDNKELVRVAKLEEEKARRDEQNEYFKLKNKELEAAKAFRDHEFYILNKVVESMLGTSVEKKFEELQVEELRAQRQAEIDKKMKEKGKGVEGSSAVTERSIVPSMVVENPEPISAVSCLFEDYTPLDELIGDSDEEDEEEEDDEEDEKDEKVYSASSHGSDDDDDDAQGGTGLKVTEASTENNVDDLMNDSVNEESGGADRQGESGDAQNVQQAQKLILRLDTYHEEGEHFHTYTLEAIKEMTRMVNPDFKFDFEEELNAEFKEELNAFDINQQSEYEYRYVEEADLYDRVEVEDWTDDESVNEDTSQLPTLMEFFTEENRDELRRKVAEF
ncbi:uncharacterized protein LOC110919241 [Helianthus annuus]|uniref:uncharacterized protein LOC110919241 n=1 Tax=Helianthus annuus TaxID=4232 RepID=UPI000B9045F9|nr:uncharacterized protein LOC110919241 [Helianthus annuus]